MGLSRLDAGRCVVAKGHAYEFPHCVPKDVSESHLRYHYLRTALQLYYLTPLNPLFFATPSPAELEASRIALARALRCGRRRIFPRCV